MVFKWFEPAYLHQKTRLASYLASLVFALGLHIVKGIIMQNGHAEYRDEELMTDYQFKYIMELKDKNSALEKEVVML